MTPLTVTIDKNTRRRYRMHEKAISFEELRRRIIGVEALASLRSASRAATKTGLSRLTSKDIEREIKAPATKTTTALELQIARFAKL